MLVQSKFGTVKSATTAQALNVAPTAGPAPGNSLIALTSAASAGGVLTFTSLKSNLGVDFIPLFNNTSVFTGLSGIYYLPGFGVGTTSVNLLYGNTTSVNVALDMLLIEVVGLVVPDASTFNTISTPASSQSLGYTNSRSGNFSVVNFFTNNGAAAITPTSGYTLPIQPNGLPNNASCMGYLDGDVNGATAFTSTSSVAIAIQWNIASFMPQIIVQPTGYSMESAEYY